MALSRPKSGFDSRYRYQSQKTPAKPLEPSNGYYRRPSLTDRQTRSYQDGFSPLATNHWPLLLCAFVPGSFEPSALQRSFREVATNSRFVRFLFGFLPMHADFRHRYQISEAAHHDKFRIKAVRSSVMAASCASPIGALSEPCLRQ